MDTSATVRNKSNQQECYNRSVVALQRKHASLQLYLATYKKHADYGIVRLYGEKKNPSLMSFFLHVITLLRQQRAQECTTAEVSAFMLIKTCSAYGAAVREN